MLTRDELLDNLMLYWLPGTGASSARLYWESIQQVRAARGARPTSSPCRPAARSSRRRSRARRDAGPRSASPTSATGTSPTAGGHFAAFEQPELFVDEVRSFFRLVR